MTGEGKVRICVFGAGAIGCYFGGLLARAGHDVTFIGRPAHVDAINARGLILETAATTEHVPARAAVDASGVDRPDLVLVCVKSADTESVADALAGPGHVKHHGGGDLVIGASPASADLAGLLTAAGIPTTVSDDIDSVLWTKLIINCAYNPLSAVGPISYAAMLETDGARAVMLDVIRECEAVAAACGVTLPPDIVDRVLSVAGRMPNQMSSTAQDLLRGKPTEIDFLNGHVVRKGAEHGIPTPANLALTVAVRLAEQGGPSGRAGTG